jgi:hypothetical protein
VCTRLFIDGQKSKAFSAVTLPQIPPDGHEAERDMVVQISRERYTTPRDVVEEKLRKWFENS